MLYDKLTRDAGQKMRLESGKVIGTAQTGNHDKGLPNLLFQACLSGSRIISQLNPPQSLIVLTQSSLISFSRFIYTPTIPQFFLLLTVPNPQGLKLNGPSIKNVSTLIVTEIFSPLFLLQPGTYIFLVCVIVLNANSLQSIIT